MINAAIVGMGWWGRTLVESVSGVSDELRFVAGVTRAATPALEEFAAVQKLALLGSLEEALADDGVDAVVLATPNSMHSSETIAGRGDRQARLRREAAGASPALTRRRPSTLPRRARRDARRRRTTAAFTRR